MTKRHLKIRFGPAGVHIFERTSGLNILLEEFATPESGWSQAPRQVSIALTNACDLTCPYCFAPKKSASLDSDDVAAWLKELDANGTIGVGFGGGEPTLYPGFSKLCAYVCQHTDLAITFTTHGHHLDPALLAGLRGNVHFIRVSMDGLGATYERLRGRSFDELRSRISDITTVAPFGINYVVNSETFRDLNGAVAFAEAAGSREFLLLPEQSVNGRTGITESEAETLRIWARRYSGRMRLAISEVAAQGFATCDPFSAENGLRGYAHIDADGVLKHTSYDRTGVPIGRHGVMTALHELRAEGT